MGRLAPEVQAAITLSQQISPILAEGTKGNPRQIKRFLNSLLLRYAIADARGFAEDIARAALAKIMLAERFMPRAFERLARIAASSDSGKVSALAALEQIARGASGKGAATPAAAERRPGEHTVRKRSAEIAAPALDPEIAELVEAWRSDAGLLAWARIDPVIGDIDLRPYLFVTRDRRAYFGGTGGESRLDAWVDRLMGSTMSVAGIEAELRAMPDGDLEQLFEVVRDRVFEADDRMVAPAGVPGLAVLAKVNASCQRRLIEMLEDLPLDGLGPWVARGWNDAFSDAGTRARLQALINRWAEQDESPSLKAAAAQLRNLPTTGRR
jgi:hypothetical protein